MESVVIGCCIHYKQVQQVLGEVGSNKPKRKRHSVRRWIRRSTRSPPASSLCSPPLSPSPSSSMCGSLARSRGSCRVSPLRFRADSFRVPVSHPSLNLNYGFVLPEDEDNTYLLECFLEDSVSEADIPHNSPPGSPQPQSQPTPPASPLATFSSPSTPFTASVSVSSSSPTQLPLSPTQLEVYSEPAIALNIPSAVPSRAAITSLPSTVTVTSTSKRDKVKLMVDRKKGWHIRRQLASTLFRTA